MKRASIAILLFLSWTWHACHAQTSHAVAFIYHQFGNDAVPQTNVPLAAFDAQLDFLERERFTVLSLGEIVTRLRSQVALPERTVAITIDDAYRSVYNQAYPRLRRRGWPMTVFVSTDAVDARSPALMTWRQMRELAEQGVEFANHSASHDYLIRRKPGEDASRWRERIERDIARAQTRIQQELGTTTMLFAYPYGEYSKELTDIVQHLGYVGIGQHSGALWEHSDFRALPRFPVNTTYSSLDDFRTKALALPLPVVRATPFDPVLAQSAAAVLEVELQGDAKRWRELKCYVNGQGAHEVTWLSQSPAIFRVEARQALPRGRSRYNCTAPSDQRGRYYWFSHLWIRP